MNAARVLEACEICGQRKHVVLLFLAVKGRKGSWVYEKCKQDCAGGILHVSEPVNKYALLCTKPGSL